MNKDRIDIFGYAEGCPACEELKTFLRAKNIPFQSINMERDSQLRDHFRDLGYATVPICFMDGYFVGDKSKLIKDINELEANTQHRIPQEA